MPNGLIDFVTNLPRRTAVLVGDLMLDRYVFGTADRVSPEAPVPVILFQNEEFRLGGAGSVLANLAALRANVRAVGVLGKDFAAEEIRKRIRAVGCDPSGLVELADRPTVTKLRLLASSQHRQPQQLMRLDFENAAPIDQTIEKRLLDNVASALEGADVVCIEDYNKGVLTGSVCHRIIEMARARKLPVIVDPAYIANYTKYAGATCIKLNRPEAERATGLPVRDEASYKPAAEALLSKLGLDAVMLTLNEAGIYLATASGERRFLRTRPRQVFDATGAGDMVLAMVSVARAAGANWADAAALGNIAGGIEVEKLGCVPITPEEIVQDLLAESRNKPGKERTLQQLLPELQKHRALGRKIVFTNGCFDIIHLGHVEYFRFAKRQGDILVVAVNTDDSIRKLKGPKRPIINEQDRIQVLGELESIDYVIKFNEDTPIPLLKEIRPDVLVKGADYSKDKVVGWDVVEAYGGRVALAPLIDGRSTSSVIQKILEAYK